MKTLALLLTLFTINCGISEIDPSLQPDMDPTIVDVAYKDNPDMDKTKPADMKPVFVCSDTNRLDPSKAVYENGKKIADYDCKLDMYCNSYTGKCLAQYPFTYETSANYCTEKDCKGDCYEAAYSGAFKLNLVATEIQKNVMMKQAYNLYTDNVDPKVFYRKVEVEVVPTGSYNAWLPEIGVVGCKNFTGPVLKVTPVMPKKYLDTIFAVVP